MVKIKKKYLDIIDNVGFFSWLTVFCIIVSAGGYFVVTTIFPEVVYDPDKHVCEEWNCKRCVGHHMYEDDCNDWRDKNKCELNPSDSSCICDEWGEVAIGPFPGYDIDYYISIKEFINSNISKCDSLHFTYIDKGKTKFINIRVNTNPFVFLTNLLYIIQEDKLKAITCKYYQEWSVYKESCIKSHEANECELGNPDYIWREHMYCDNVKCSELLPLGWNESNDTFEMGCDCPERVFHYGRENVVIEIKKTCRRRELRDATCDELLALLDGKSFYKSKGNVLDWFESWAQDDIRFMIMNKGCFQ